MKDAFAHCEALVRDADKDRFLATLFAPADRRGALFALYAFTIEIGRVSGAVTQPLAGEIRLQWWVEALEGKRPEEAPANPVAAAMMDTATRYRLPLPRLLDIVEESRIDLYEVSDIEPRIDAASAVFALAMRILGGEDDADLAGLARHAGIAWASQDKDRALRHLAETGALATAAPPAVLPALLPLVLVRPALEQRSLAQWRRQWLMWRAARDPRRIFR